MIKLKKVFLVRHGQTSKAKKDDNRKLTSVGIGQITKAASVLKKTHLGNCVVVSTPKVRSRESAKIIANALLLPKMVFMPNMRVLGIEKLLRFKKRGEDLTFCYLHLVGQKKLPVGLTKPKVLIKNFTKLINSYNKFDTLIFVGHAGGLETLAFYQNKFKVKRLPRKELKYGQIIVLTRT